MNNDYTIIVIMYNVTRVLNVKKKLTYVSFTKQLTLLQHEFIIKEEGKYSVTVKKWNNKEMLSAAST